MAKCQTYAEIAQAVYQKQPAPHPVGHMIKGWQIKQEHWENGTEIGNGFQGGIYQNDAEVIVGFCGTAIGTRSTFSDLSADARIALNILPNQCSSAYRMTERAKEILNGRKLSVTGHSLGGALAQVIGVWSGVPFVTFNAPPMKNALRMAKVNIVKPQMMMRSRGKSVDDVMGINFRVEGDIVSAAGMKHVGKVITMDQSWYAVKTSHFMTKCLSFLQKKGYGSKSLDEVLKLAV